MTTGEKGVLFIQKSKLHVTIELNDEPKAYKDIPDSYEGRFIDSYIKIVHPRVISHEIWNNPKEETTGCQITLTYDYCIVSDVKNLSSNKISGLEITFPVLFHRPQKELKQAIKSSNKCLEITTLSDNASSMFSIKFKRLISIEEAIIYRTKFERFFTSLLGTYIQAETVRLSIGDNYPLLVTSDRPLHPQAKKIEPPSIYPIQETVNLLKAYVTNFEKIGYATHLHAAFVEYYSDQKIYLESSFSVLFAGIDSIYSKLTPTSSKKELSRISEYDTFISDAEKIASAKLIKFLKKVSTKQAYTRPVSFQSKLNTVYDYVGEEKLEPALSERINILRNNIVHGNDYNFDDFVTEWTDPKTQKTYPAITSKDIKNIDHTLWRAIKKLANQ